MSIEPGVQVIILFRGHLKKTARDRGGGESRFTLNASLGDEVLKKSLYQVAFNRKKKDIDVRKKEIRKITANITKGLTKNYSYRA